MSVNARFAAIQTANSRSPRQFQRAVGEDGQPLTAAELYGRNTFSLEVMSNKLPKPVYKRVEACISRGEALSKNDADVVAHAVKEWALDNGVTHFTHWFQPMTGSTAEKHDAFLTFSGGQAVERFTGDMLIQSEPDASSFPSGGTRTTFEARGYTAWDPTSPAFLRHSPNGVTLTIPTIFCSWTGESLDTKTPLLRSDAALDRSARRLLELLREEGEARPGRVFSNVGPEQEFFLVDRELFYLRPDLSATGRTLFGAAPPKGQEQDDHYFATTPNRVMAFMQHLERRLWKLGIPIKTRHNEVAPGQFEMAPIYEPATVAGDHNMLMMDLLHETAERHGFKCLLHEKPYRGLNGSGKHDNYSVGDDLGNNMFDPGDNPHENQRFMVFLTALIVAVTNPKAIILIAALFPQFISAGGVDLLGFFTYDIPVTTGSVDPATGKMEVDFAGPIPFIGELSAFLEADKIAD